MCSLLVGDETFEVLHSLKIVVTSNELFTCTFDKFMLLIISVHSALSNSYCNLYYTFDRASV